MSAWDLIPATAALGWSTLVTNIAILPFYSAREKWHKDYVESGAMAQAAASIDSKKMLPSLAEIVDLVIAERGRTKSKDDTAVLLQNVDFLPSLEKVEAATTEKSQLDRNLHAIEFTAKRLWRCGLVHVGATVAVWAVVVIGNVDIPKRSGSTTPLGSGPPHSPVFWVVAVLAGAVWIVSLGLACRHFFKYDQRRDDFLTALKANR